MAFPIEPPIDPMLSAAQDEIPARDGWLYEPKWDGFRALIFRDGDQVHIGSRNALPLARYFPEIVEIARAGLPRRCVIDGEIVIAGNSGLDFDALQLRLHPAASRVAKLSKEIPASFVAFDLLALDDDLRGAPFAQRRAALVDAVRATDDMFVTPQTGDREIAQDWFERFEGAGLDGLIAKRADGVYESGVRAMVKIKHRRTADCVLVGYRLNKAGDGIGSFMLGVYSDGEMHHIGYMSSFKAAERRAMLEQVQPLVLGSREGGTPSRWTQGKDTSWIELRPQLVAEVAYDHLQGGWRFRHGARFVRWRPDKDQTDCTDDQFQEPAAFALSDIRMLG